MVSFQNWITCEERIPREKTKKFVLTGQYNDEISSFSCDEFFPHVLIDFKRVCYVSLQRFEKAVNLSFQNQFNTRGKNKNSSREN
jgi:hypothetical protein